MKPYQDYITSDPSICHGLPCVKGTRIPVSVVLDNLAEELSLLELQASYPSLTRESIHAVLAYAADLAREEVISLTA